MALRKKGFSNEILSIRMASKASIREIPREVGMKTSLLPIFLLVT